MSLKIENIEELVMQSKNGSKESYSELIVLIQQDLFRVAMSRLGNEENVKDAIQNTIFSAYLNIKKLRNNAYFKTWITKILINECNRIYKNSKKEDELLENFANVNLKYTDTSLNFDSIISILDENKKKIFELYYKDELTVKQISKKLNMSENTIKSELSRGRQQIKKSFKEVSIIIIILCLFITTSVIAISIINYIKSLFNVNPVGAENDGVLMAIENLDWYQEVDMSYIDLGNGYKIKAEYFLMDEMNLYLVFDFESEKDISNFNNVSLYDLKIENEYGEVICDRGNILLEQSQMAIGDKLIEKSSHHMKSLIYMYTDSFPISKTLNISFSNITLYTKKSINTLDCTVNFKIDLSDKFINRKYTYYNSNDVKVSKALITETGFYAIIETDDFMLENIKLLDEYNNVYNCYVHTLSKYNDSSVHKYIVISNFNNIDSKNLKLKFDNKDFELTQK